MNKSLLSAAATILPLITSHAAIISNGDLNTAITQYGSAAGNSTYTIDGVGNVTENAVDTLVDVDEWVWASVTRGFEYSATGGDTGEGGAFIQSAGDDFNQKPRAVLQFAQDSQATTGDVSISMDVFFDDNSAANALFFNIELFAWDSGDIAPGLSVAGATGNDATYNVTSAGEATLLLNNVQLAASSFTDATWETASIASSLDLGVGYDFYAWRIGVVGGTPGDTFAFDNLTVTAIPEPDTYALLASLTGFTFIMLRRRQR